MELKSIEIEPQSVDYHLKIKLIRASETCDGPLKKGAVRKELLVLKAKTLDLIS